MNISNSTEALNLTSSSTSSLNETTTPPLLDIFRAFSLAISESSELSLLDWERFGPFLTYCRSSYGFSCLLMAFILNRTLILASTNTSRVQMFQVNRQLGIHNAGGIGGSISRKSYLKSELTRIAKLVMVGALRLLTIGLLVFNLFNVLVALDWTWKLKDDGIGHDAVFGTSWWFRSACRLLLFGFEYNPDWYATMKYMKTPRTEIQIGPTADMYWPIFLGFCFLLFVETFISVVQGRKPYNESGITIFEHSSAFHQASLKGIIFESWTRWVQCRPTEQVLICLLFLILNHLSIHIGGWMSTTNKYRLIPLTIFGLSFIAYFINNMVNCGIFGMFYFPLIIIFSYIPQFIFICIITLCLSLSLLAYVVNGFQLNNLNYVNLFQRSHEEAGAEGLSYLEWFLSRNFNVRLSDDFYTSLLNLGSLMVTMVGKLYYIKELGIITVSQDTWLERDLMSGYGNVIAAPGEWLLKGQSLIEYEQTVNISKFEDQSVVKKRSKYINEVVGNLFQLIWGISFKFYNWISRSNANQVPTFLQKFIQPPEDPSRTTISLIEVDNLRESQLTSQLLLDELSSVDNSKDYCPGDENGREEGEDMELDLEVEEITDLTMELIPSSNEFVELVHTSQELRYHMDNTSTGVMTRSRYLKLTQNENESTKLLKLILEKRKKLEKEALLKVDEDDDDTEEYSSSRYDCVVCQCNPREIITWPCKCFAVCEQCRISLTTKGMEGCVICRKEVEGVTRVFIP